MKKRVDKRYKIHRGLFLKIHSGLFLISMVMSMKELPGCPTLTLPGPAPLPSCPTPLLPSCLPLGSPAPLPPYHPACPLARLPARCLLRCRAEENSA